MDPLEREFDADDVALIKPYEDIVRAERGLEGYLPHPIPRDNKSTFRDYTKYIAAGLIGIIAAAGIFYMFGQIHDASAYFEEEPTIWGN